MQDAIGKGDARRLGELIRQDPGFNVNKPDGNGITFLHFACMGADSRSAVIPLLLAHPNIEVNSKSKDGETPFYYACYYGQTSSVRLLLKDSRVKVNEPTIDGSTPLKWAASNGRLDTIKWWIALGSDMDLRKFEDVDKSDAIAAAKKRGKTEVVTLLKRFKGDASKIRSEVRKELGIDGQCYSYYSPSYSPWIKLILKSLSIQISLSPLPQSSPGSSTSPSLVASPFSPQVTISTFVFVSNLRHLILSTTLRRFTPCQGPEITRLHLCRHCS